MTPSAKRFSLVHPSRGRPDQARATLERWLGRAARADRVEHVLAVDRSDPSLPAYRARAPASTRLVISDGDDVVSATNVAAAAARGDVLVYLSDDFDCPPAWDQRLEAEAARHGLDPLTAPFLIRVDDGLQASHARIATVPIVSRALYQRLGYFWHPEYRSMFVDRDLFEVCDRMGVVVAAPQLRFQHRHHSVGEATHDPTYRRSEAHTTQGQRLFAARAARGFEGGPFDPRGQPGMRLAAIYNVFDGLELLEGSIRCIYPLSSHVIVQFQTISNHGERDPSILDVVRDLEGRYPRLEMVEFRPDFTLSPGSNEFRKRAAGIDVARRRGASHYMLMDCDEYYVTADLERAQARISEGGYDSSACRLYTYYRSPRYRLDPMEDYYVPVIHAIGLDLSDSYPVPVDPTRKSPGERFYAFDPSELIMHHYSWVRKDVAKKLRNSSARRNWDARIPEFVSQWHAFVPGNAIAYYSGRSVVEVEDLFDIGETAPAPRVHQTLEGALGDRTGDGPPPDLVLHHHLGLGDHLVCNGLVHAISERFGTVHLPCKRHNLGTVECLYADFDDIEVFAVDEEYGDVLRYCQGRQIDLLQVGFDRCDPRRWDVSFYDQLDLPFELRYQRFTMPRSIPHEDEIYDLLVDSDEYCLVHREASVGTYDLAIDTRLPIVEIRKIDEPYDNLLNYRRLIQEAAEIHCVNSSALHLVNSLRPHGDLYFHDVRPQAAPHLGDAWRVVGYGGRGNRGG